MYACSFLLGGPNGASLNNGYTPYMHQGEGEFQARYNLALPQLKGGGDSETELLRAK